MCILVVKSSTWLHPSAVRILLVTLLAASCGALCSKAPCVFVDRTKLANVTRLRSGISILVVIAAGTLVYHCHTCTDLVMYQLVWPARARALLDCPALPAGCRMYLNVFAPQQLSVCVGLE